jgi:hypothetical protein
MQCLRSEGGCFKDLILYSVDPSSGQVGFSLRSAAVTFLGPVPYICLVMVCSC